MRLVFDLNDQTSCRKIRPVSFISQFRSAFHQRNAYSFASMFTSNSSIYRQSGSACLPLRCPTSHARTSDDRSNDQDAEVRTEIDDRYGAFVSEMPMTPLGTMPNPTKCFYLGSNWSTLKPTVVNTRKRCNAGLRFAPDPTFILPDSEREQPHQQANRLPHAALCLA